MWYLRATRFAYILTLLSLCLTFSQRVTAANKLDLTTWNDLFNHIDVYLKQGQQYTVAGQYERATEVYLKALALTKKFPNLVGTQRFTLIKRFGSYSHSLAIPMLQDFIVQQKYNLDAHILLARYLSWGGHQQAAIKIVDQALKLAGDNPKLLLIKADALRWRGDYPDARIIYRQLILNKNSFEAQVGYVHTLLKSDHYAQTITQRAKIKPLTAFQRQALDEFDMLILRETEFKARLLYEYYRDSDNNRRFKAGIRLEQPFDASRLALTLSSGRATEAGRHIEFDEIYISDRFTLSDRTRLEVEVGQAQVYGSKDKDVTAGHLELISRLPGLDIRAKVYREIFDETALILDNGIIVDGLDTHAGYQMTDRTAFNLDYELKDYSDDNRSSHLQAEAWYAIRLQPMKWRIGYRHEAISFERQSGSGYFDPSQLYSNQLRFGVSKYLPNFDFNLELFYGKQSFVRFGSHQTDTVGGWYSSLNYYPGKRLGFELEWEGGNFAMQTIGGFRYQMLTVKANFIF